MVKKTIEEVAYKIWQEEGCPHGRDNIHWEMAKAIVEEAAAKKPAVVKQATVKKANPTVKKIAKKVIEKKQK
jgi:hypothetical protein